MTVDIRRLGPTDAGVLRHVAADVFDHHVDPKLVDEFLADPRHHIVVALDAGTVVGMVSAVDYVHPDKPRELWINEVAVAPSHHRQGVGRQMMSEMLTHARELGCSEAWVLAEASNTTAQAFYKDLGGYAESSVMFTFDVTE